MAYPPDTIAAIATPPGHGGIGVVRVSGAKVPGIALALAGRALPPRVASLARFAAADGAAIDEGLALYFPAPHSYTGEHVLELHGHGGPTVLRLVLGRCLELGARLAAPGEFTQRAFLNGKLDLAQAEGVADLIDAATATAARAALRSLSGAFSTEVQGVVAALIELRALTEATLDFPDEDIDFLRASDAAGRLATIARRLETLLAASRAGKLLRDGISVVLIGEPNVGKSSLLNGLAGEEAAIVTPVPGTTRDTVERQIEIGGIALTVIDTAGLRATDDPIETLGIERTWAAVRKADLVLVLVDARAPQGEFGASTAQIQAGLPPALPRIVVHNKIDLAGLEARMGAAPEDTGAAGARDVWLSALTGTGIDFLRQAILAAAGAHGDLEGAYLARERHLVALREAATRIAAAGDQLASEAPALELMAEELRAAQASLSRITGEFAADDLLGAIFTRFCIGK